MCCNGITSSKGSKPVMKYAAAVPSVKMTLK